MPKQAKTVMIRIGAPLHKKVKIYAAENDISITEAADNLIESGIIVAKSMQSSRTGTAHRKSAR